MAKIVINIDMESLTSGINQVVDDDYEDEMEGEFACPLVTYDEEMNADNRQYAVDEFSYGPSEKNWEKKPQKCGICEYYNIRHEMMECIAEGMGDSEGVGYCTKLDFVCSEANVCNAYEEGGPMTDYEEMDDMEPIEGGSKDIF
jgi:hypothetical protein